MANLRQTLDRIREAPRCILLPARGRPSLRSGDALPDDLAEFYDLAAEQSLLWTLEGELERLLVEPLHKDYVGLVEAARAHIAGTDASSEGER